jgi:N-acetylglutamate synthase-like GNAT family acetyltransferase
MDIVRTILETTQVRFEVVDEVGQLARASGVIVRNQLHKEPYMLIEDVFVRDDARGRGMGVVVVNNCITEARILGCYKIVLCCRVKDELDLPTWYTNRFGFKRTVEVPMRMDLL